MTTPDTLAELIAKLDHFGEDKYFTILHHKDACLKCQFQAALDALVEKLIKKWREAPAYNSDMGPEDCADELEAELRGRGANE